MKAWQISAFGLDRLEMNEIRTPEPLPGEVLVKVHAVSLNYRDLLTVRGQYNARMPLPSTVCSDAAGEVVAVGDGVKAVRAGQRVTGIFMQHWIDGSPTPQRCRGALGGDLPGVLSEYTVFREQGVVPIPERLSYAQAATLPCAAVTAWNAVMHAANLRPGDTVLIQGTGGVSIFALQFAKLLNVTVLGTSSSNEKLARARDLGLDAGVNYKEIPNWSKWVLEQTRNLGAQLIVEVGGMGTLNESLKCVCMGGVIAQIGVLGQSDEPLQIPRILRQQAQLKGIYVGSRAHFEEMNRAIEKSSLEPVIGEMFTFDQARQAFETMKNALHFGKIVIQVA